MAHHGDTRHSVKSAKVIAKPGIPVNISSIDRHSADSRIEWKSATVGLSEPDPNPRPGAGSLDDRKQSRMWERGTIEMPQGRIARPANVPVKASSAQAMRQAVAIGAPAAARCPLAVGASGKDHDTGREYSLGSRSQTPDRPGRMASYRGVPEEQGDAKGLPRGPLCSHRHRPWSPWRSRHGQSIRACAYRIVRTIRRIRHTQCVFVRIPAYSPSRGVVVYTRLKFAHPSKTNTQNTPSVIRHTLYGVYAYLSRIRHIREKA
jgi:hypothetical protein